MEYWLISLIILLLINIVACMYVANQDEFERKQKLLQCVIIWLFPFLGAIGIFLLVKSLGELPQKNKGSFGGGSNDSSFISSSGGSNENL